MHMHKHMFMLICYGCLFLLTYRISVQINSSPSQVMSNIPALSSSQLLAVKRSRLTLT